MAHLQLERSSVSLPIEAKGLTNVFHLLKCSQARGDFVAGKTLGVSVVDIAGLRLSREGYSGARTSHTRPLRSRAPSCRSARRKRGRGVSSTRKKKKHLAVVVGGGVGDDEKGGAKQNVFRRHQVCRFQHTRMIDSERLSELGTSPPSPSQSSPPPPGDASTSSYSDVDLGIIVGPLLIGVILCSYIIYVFARRRRQLQEMYIDPESDTSSLNSAMSASSREQTDEDNQRLIPHHRR